MDTMTPTENLKRSLKRGVSLGKLKKSRFPVLDNAIKGILSDAIDGIAESAGDWAEETYYSLIGNTPHDTYNLRNSLDVFVYNDGIGVGVNEKKLLLGAPKYLPSHKHPGIMREIPPYNYVPMAEMFTKEIGDAGKSLKNFTKVVWVELARKNARAIFVLGGYNRRKF